MPKPLDEIVARALFDASAEAELLVTGPLIDGGAFALLARAALAALEKEGHVVVKLREPLSDADIESMTGVTDLIRGTPNPLAPGAPTPQQDRLLSEMAARHGISHPQAVYTPEPPGEAVDITSHPNGVEFRGWASRIRTLPPKVES